MAVAGAEEGRIDVEVAAGNDQAVDGGDVVLDQRRLMREEKRQATGAGDRAAVVLPERKPGEPGVAAGAFGVDRDPNAGLRHWQTLCRTGAGRKRGP